MNARHIKNVPGRFKTDVEDAEWIQELHTYGLVSSSFRPEEDMCAVRSLTRHRDMLTKHRSIHILSFNFGFSWNELCPSTFAINFHENLFVQIKGHVSCHEKTKLNDNTTHAKKFRDDEFEAL